MTRQEDVLGDAVVTKRPVGNNGRLHVCKRAESERWMFFVFFGQIEACLAYGEPLCTIDKHRTTRKK